MDEPALNYDVLLPLPDHIQLSIDDYRDKLYEMIQQDKAYLKRTQNNRTVTNSNSKHSITNNR